jgi:hypothetical protein
MGGESPEANHPLIDHVPQSTFRPLAAQNFVHTSGRQEMVKHQVEVIGVQALQAPLHLPHGAVVRPFVHLRLQEHPGSMSLHGEPDPLFAFSVGTVVGAGFHELDTHLDGTTHEVGGLLVVGDRSVEAAPGPQTNDGNLGTGLSKRPLGNGCH